MKSDPWRQQLASYPFTFDIVTRYGDVDRNDHINNVAVAQLYEELRVRFAHHAREGGSAELANWTKMVVAEVRISYLREMRYPGIVTGGIGIQRIGNASYQLACALFQGGICASVAEVVLVCFNEGRSRPIPEPVRQRLQAWLIRLPG
jgi:acyl-CoA thioester hydrolase